jgi:hypothetical protein
LKGALAASVSHLKTADFMISHNLASLAFEPSAGSFCANETGLEIVKSTERKVDSRI